MPIAQTGDQIAPPTILAPGGRPNAMRRIWANIGKAPFGDSNLPTQQNLTGLDIDQLAIFDNQIRRLSASSHCHKARRGFGPRFKFAFFQIFTHNNRVRLQSRMRLIEL